MEKFDVSKSKPMSRTNVLKCIQDLFLKEGVVLNLIDEGIGVTDAHGRDALLIAVQLNNDQLTDLLLEAGIGDVEKAYNSRTLWSWLSSLPDGDARLTYRSIGDRLEKKLREKASAHMKPQCYYPRQDLAAMYIRSQHERRLHND